MIICNQCYGFFVVYVYVVEGCVDSCCCRKWFVVVIWVFWVNVNQIYFGCIQWCFCQCFWMTVSQLGFFIILVNIQIWFLDVFMIGIKIEGMEVGVFQCYVICEDKQVGLGDFLIIFLFDWL